MDHYSFLRWKVEDRIATVWLSRPPVNAVNQEMYREIAALFGVTGLAQDIPELHGHKVKPAVFD